MMLRRTTCIFILALLCAPVAFAASKPHVISFGKVSVVKLFLGPDEDHTAPMRIRPLYVDTKLKEFTTGEVHDVTDRIFVVRRAFRLNNNLPENDSRPPSWVWQRGGWLMVDRLTARVSQISLFEFDPFYSHASWFRDYVAYCGITDNGERVDAVVMQLGRKKPVLKKELGPASGGDSPESECDAPTWERKPTTVNFLPKKVAKQSFTIFGHAADVAPGSDEE